MAVIGPDPPDVNSVDSAYWHIRKYLADFHSIQRHESEIITGFGSFIRTEEEREKRNKALYDAIYSLFELEQWESF